MPTASAATLTEDPPCGRLLLVLLDLTGSFSEQLPSAVAETKRLLLGLGPGDCFLVRGISAESFGAANDVVPLVRLPLASRHIDADHTHRMMLIKRAIARNLDRVLGRKAAGRTDLWQALYAASLSLRTLQAERKEIHLFSDLKDNRGLQPRRLPLRLQGVWVRLHVARHADRAETFEARVGSWTQHLEKAGATVSFAELSPKPPMSATGGKR